jgi:hypothetical protein
VLTLRGWIGGLGGAAAVTVGVVVAALIAAGLTTFHGGSSHVTLPATAQKLALGSSQGQVAGALAAASPRRGTQTSSRRAPVTRTHGRKPALTGHSGPVSQRRGGAQVPTPVAPVPGGSRDRTSSPATASPVPSTPAPGSGGGGNGGGGTVQQPPSLGNTVKNTTQQLGDTVNNTTQTLGDTVGAVSPVLGNSVKQTGPALGDTVKSTGDLVGNTVNGLLGGHH